jgi:hypothetical protein
MQPIRPLGNLAIRMQAARAPGAAQGGGVSEYVSNNFACNAMRIVSQ